MKIDLTNLENEVNLFARDVLNKAGEAANEAAIEHIESTYNTKVDSGSISTDPATTNNLTFKIIVKGRSVSLLKKVTRVTNRGAHVLVKRGSPKFIKSAFVAPWQKNSSKRFLFLKKQKRRRSLYTVGLVKMFKSRGTMKAINKSLNKTIRKFK